MFLSSGYAIVLAQSLPRDDRGWPSRKNLQRNSVDTCFPGVNESKRRRSNLVRHAASLCSFSLVKGRFEGLRSMSKASCTKLTSCEGVTFTCFLDHSSQNRIFEIQKTVRYLRCIRNHWFRRRNAANDMVSHREHNLHDSMRTFKLAKGI